MKKFFIFLIGFFLGVLIFMPKDNLYYTAQKFLSKENIYINSGIKNGIFLDLYNGKIYKNGIDFAEFKDIKIIPYFLFNQIRAKNININFQNLKINHLKITYSIINPIKIYISAKANFGIITGEVNLFKRFIKIYILNLTNNNIKSFLQKDKKGYFYYAKF